MSNKTRRSRLAPRPAPAPTGSPEITHATLLPLGALAAGFGLALTPLLAHAQNNAPVPQPPAATASAAGMTTLPEVKVKASAEESGKEALQTTKSSIGKGQQEIRDIPQSLTVVTERLLEDAKLETLRQALHYTAGITFAATENGTDQDIRLRGFPVATTGDLLIDGMKDPSQYDRDSFNYDRIEVLRGSASMLFGRGSTGGVINQVTKRPTVGNARELQLTAGTGNSLRLTGDFNVQLDSDTAFRINAMANRADNGGAKIDKKGFAPSFRWGMGTRDDFTLNLFYLDVDNVPMSNLRYLSGGLAAAIPAKNFYGTDSDYLLGRAAYASGSWLHRFDGGGELRTQFRSGNFKRSAWGTTAGYCSVALTATGICPNNPAPPAVTPATLSNSTALTRSGLSPRKDDIDGTYLQSDYSQKFSWGGLRHELSTGVDASRESADRFGAWGGVVGTNYNKGGTTVGTPDDGRVLSAHPIYRKTSDYKGTAFGAYLQDLLALTPQWKLLAGARYDRFSADMHQVNYANATTDVPSAVVASRLRYSSLWSGRAGLLYQPTDSQSYHLSYGTSFNTSADTYQYTTQTIADVPAEKSRNIELGAKLDWLDGQLSTRMAIFRTEKYNERTTDSDFAGTYPVLSGKRHSQGMEIDVVGRVTPALEVYLSYSYIDEAKIDKVGTAATGAGSPVGLTPRHTGAAWLSYQLLPQLRVGGGLRGAAHNRPLQGTSGAASTTAKVPGYVAYDLMAEYTINQTFTARLNVGNVGNKVYGDQLYPGFYTPGETRSVKLTLVSQF